jgi:hypothetical protein
MLENIKCYKNILFKFGRSLCIPLQLISLHSQNFGILENFGDM